MVGAVKFGSVENNFVSGLVAARLCGGGIYPGAYLRYYYITLADISPHSQESSIGCLCQIKGQ
jgi:hypothetical protein